MTQVAHAITSLSCVGGWEREGGHSPHAAAHSAFKSSSPAQREADHCMGCDSTQLLLHGEVITAIAAQYPTSLLPPSTSSPGATPQLGSIDHHPLLTLHPTTLTRLLDSASALHPRLTRHDDAVVAVLSFSHAAVIVEVHPHQ